MRIVIPGPPQGKARARTVRNGNFTRSYTPEKTVLYENLVKTCYLEQSDEKWMDKEPLAMRIFACFPIPKSTTKKDRARMYAGKLYPTKKPDADNIAKVICDALNGVAYADDTQIVRLEVRKYYSDEPKVEFEIKEIE